MKNPVSTDKDPTPIESRMRHIKALDRRLPDEVATSAFPPITVEQFKKRLCSLRDGIYRWGGQRIKEIFIENLSEKYPHLRLQGRGLTSVTAFCKFVRLGPWDDTMRAIVHYAQDGMWESDNKWSINLEKELADLLAITWSGAHANELHKPERNTDGNCFHHLFVKRKASLCTRIRDTTKRTWLEAIYARQPAARESYLNKNKSQIPKVVEYIKIEFCVSGFRGILGYCTGHPKLKKPRLVVAGSPSGENASSISGGSDSSPDPIHFPHLSRRGNDADDVSVGSVSVSIATPGCNSDYGAIFKQYTQVQKLEYLLAQEKKRLRDEEMNGKFPCMYH